MVPQKSQTQRVVQALFLVLASVAFGSACGSKQAVEEEPLAELARPERARFGNLSKAGTNVEESDVNLDGKPDTLRFSRGGSLAWIERDLDFDGTVEMFEYFDGNATVVEQEFQLDFDDNIDVVRYFENGVLARKEFATGFDGRPAITKYFDGQGTLIRVERDSDGNGLIEGWEYYQNGRLYRVGRDTNDDGQPDSIQMID